MKGRKTHIAVVVLLKVFLCPPADGKKKINRRPDKGNSDSDKGVYKRKHCQIVVLCLSSSIPLME